ncbi:response regulator [Cytophagaceae bacterium ABcell3]|nr:response regulator [Cytophagaceae bacterium ABcell3]
MEEAQINILYIDDEVNNLNVFKATFRFSYNIFLAESPTEGRKILDENDIHIIITDQRMPEMTGVEFLSSILDVHPDPIRILLTGYSDINAVIDAINKGKIYHYVGKPWDEAQIKIVIDKAFEVYSLRKENKELIEKLSKANEQLEFLLRQNLLS